MDFSECWNLATASSLTRELVKVYRFLRNVHARRLRTLRNGPVYPLEGKFPVIFGAFLREALPKQLKRFSAFPFCVNSNVIPFHWLNANSIEKSIRGAAFEMDKLIRAPRPSSDFNKSLTLNICRERCNIRPHWVTREWQRRAMTFFALLCVRVFT